MTHPTDLYVGERIRQRRHMLGMTQTDLATKVGVKFQQLQKYETGANRVSASRLADIAKETYTPVAWFFAGIDDNGTPMDKWACQTNDECQLLDLFRNMTGQQRRSILEIGGQIIDATKARKRA